MKQNNTTVISKTNLISEWDFEANKKLGLNPDVLFTNSTKKAWWICKSCRHKWQTQISVRKKGHGCPQCAHYKTGKDNASLKESNKSLLAVFPDVIKVWNYQKNGELKPDNLAAGSNKKVWWKCSECGKEWQTTIYAKAKFGTTTCKECTFKHLDRSYYVKPGINDLASCNKRVSAEWDYEKNGDLKPEDVPAHSATKVWWKCEKGHRWQASVLSRTKEGYRGCPVCANRLIVEGVNDLATTRPDLAKNWNYEKTVILNRKISLLDQIKKYGGNAKKVTNGKLCQTFVTFVHIVSIRKSGQVLMILLLSTQNYLQSGTTQKTESQNQRTLYMVQAKRFGGNAPSADTNGRRLWLVE